jgi:imidazolonepropionase
MGSAPPARTPPARTPPPRISPRDGTRRPPATPRPGLLVTGAAEIVTMAGGLRRGTAQADAGILAGDSRGGGILARDRRTTGGTTTVGDNLTHDADPLGRGLAVAAWEGRIVAVGPGLEVFARLRSLGLDPEDRARFDRLDVRGCTVTPGLIDPHTHLVFAGTREGEIELRRRGAGYLEILAAGGGILSTVARTRAASVEDLLAHGRRWLDEMLAHGTTTVEAKSGYGLDRETEVRQLVVANRLDRDGPVEIVPTFLGAHAVAPEFRGRPDATDAYVADVIRRQLPAVADQGIARYCDVFCEEGVFSPAQSRRVLEAGVALGLRPRLHADELRPSGGAELAADIGAASADHLAVPSVAGIDALARAADEGRAVVATLLPATTLFLGHAHDAPARELIERGVPVALGSDFNPGTSPTPNLQLVLSLAVLRLEMTAAEALAAVTVNAAYALGLGETHGSIEVGRQADLVAWAVPTHAQIPYWLGANLVLAVVKRGRLVHPAS